MNSLGAQEVTSANFSQFIKSNHICVLRAQMADVYGFNIFLHSKLKNEFKEAVNFGCINTQTVDYKNDAIQEFIKFSMAKIGLENIGTILPGYYLFKGGVLKAYHPATPDLNKIDPQVEGVAAIIGLIGGLFVGFVEKNATKGFEVFFQAMEAPVGEKVFQFFREILGAKSSSYSHKRQNFVFDEEVLNAYKLLNINSSATDEEVSKAWKRLLALHHPDKHPNDIEAKTKYCVELNNANEIIKKYRKKNQ